MGTFDSTPGKIGLIVFVAFFAFFFIFAFAPFQFDLAPASGHAVGYILYQEKSGFWQQEQICWRDSQYDYCEFFNPEPGVKYQLGKYEIDYTCERFIWNWEKASLCTVNSNKYLSADTGQTQTVK